MHNKDVEFEFFKMMIGIIIANSLFFTIILGFLGELNIGGIVGVLLGGLICQIVFVIVPGSTFKKHLTMSGRAWKYWGSVIYSYIHLVINFVKAFVFYHVMNLFVKE